MNDRKMVKSLFWKNLPLIFECNKHGTVKTFEIGTQDHEIHENMKIKIQDITVVYD
jgi:hypothetical protein